ncbi:MAG TPA: hypothetical protein VHG70_01515 [Nocardioidaceae bacterium]|nr:hypothetical protein [Nocardioidaceae bacterium]
MRFTEHELTVAITGAAKSAMATKKFRKGGVDIDTAWENMDRYQRFKLLDTVGSQILPVLAALPDVEVAPGTRPAYSAQQVQEVVAGLVGDDLGKIRRLATIKARTALVQTALTHIPPRPDPDALGGNPGP